MSLHKREARLLRDIDVVQTSIAPRPTDAQGQADWDQGSKASIREVPGGQKAANDLFDDLAAGGTAATAPTYPGKMIDLPGGGRVGLRPKSKSGEPTIDIDISGIPIKKIKFV